jgi:hypothetical protein
MALTVAACTAAVMPAQAAAHHPDAGALERYAAPAATGVVGPDDPASFNATLPNGRRVTPAGLSTMVGAMPLGSALSPDGRFLIVSTTIRPPRHRGVRPHTRRHAAPTESPPITTSRSCGRPT